MNPPMDEFEVLGALRGAPVPIVKCVTNDIYVPADAEYVLEGYLDPKGHAEPEGPYGEYVGYYGVVKKNPVFHLTAITHRKDALFQTVTIGGKRLGRTDTAQLTTVKTEVRRLGGLVTAVREPVALLRHAIERRHVQRARLDPPARAGRGAQRHRRGVRLAWPRPSRCSCSMTTSTCSPTSRCDWGLATRYQGDRDTIQASGFRVVPLDPSLGGARIGAKIGFDCTIPFGKRQSLEWGVPVAPVLPKANGKAKTPPRKRSPRAPRAFSN